MLSGSKTLAVVERESVCVRCAYRKFHPTTRWPVIDVSSVVPAGTRVNKETEKQFDRTMLAVFEFHQSIKGKQKLQKRNLSAISACCGSAPRVVTTEKYLEQRPGRPKTSSRRCGCR